jgi:phosphohistidine phosphatase
VRVYLVQHGRAKSKEEDPQRRLTDKGIGEVEKVADFLRPLELRIDAVWHSGKARAQQTAELLAEAVSDRDRVVQREGLGPKDQVAPTKQALEKNGRDVMIVGHLPFLDKLERRDRRKWKIAWMITPALLPS